MRKLKEPYAVYSNLVYIVLAVAVAVMEPANSLLIVSLFFLGVASAVFHIQGSVEDTIAHRADEGAIYVVLATLIHQSFGIGALYLIPIFALVAYSIYNLEKVNLTVFAPIASGLIVAGVIVTGGLSAAGAVIVTGLAAGITRFKGANTDKQHAFWHILSALAMYFAWLASL